MKTVILVSGDIVLSDISDRILKGAYKTAIFSNLQSALDYIYNSLPNLIILDIAQNDPGTISILEYLKEEPMFSRLPVLALIPDGFTAADLESLLIEDYVWKKDLEKEILPRVNLAILRSERNVEVNPLTRLPGNISIFRQIQDRLERGDVFAFAYADIDYFKPYNDKYGFSRGDDVIKITGRLIMNIVKSKQPQKSFIGHIGGDDFVFIMDVDLVEDTCREIIGAFDRIIPTLYDGEDRMKGYIESNDRQGTSRIFPFMTLSIGVTDTAAKNYNHYGELTEAASEMKKFAKKFRESCYKLDRRRIP
ncbi:MAG: diguanylate cyclase domain-containing protein [Syntrophales bacterium]